MLHCYIYICLTENSPENEWREKAMAAANEHQKLYEQYQDLEQKYTKLNEDSNLVQFKNQLLIEMVWTRYVNTRVTKC